MFLTGGGLPVNGSMLLSGVGCFCVRGLSVPVLMTSVCGFPGPEKLWFIPMFNPNLHSHTEKQTEKPGMVEIGRMAVDSLSRKAFILSLVGKKYLESQIGKFKRIVISHPCTAGQSWCEVSVDGWWPLKPFLHCPIIQSSFKKELNKVRVDIVVYFIHPSRRSIPERTVMEAFSTIWQSYIFYAKSFILLLRLSLLLFLLLKTLGQRCKSLHWVDILKTDIFFRLLFFVRITK